MDLQKIVMEWTTDKAEDQTQIHSVTRWPDQGVPSCQEMWKQCDKK